MRSIDGEAEREKFFAHTLIVPQNSELCSRTVARPGCVRLGALTSRQEKETDTDTDRASACAMRLSSRLDGGAQKRLEEQPMAVRVCKDGRVAQHRPAHVIHGHLVVLDPLE